MKQIITFLVFVVSLNSAQVFAEESRYTQKDCEFTNEQVAIAFKDKLIPFFNSIQAPLDPDSFSVIEAALDPDRSYSIPFATAKSIKFSTASGAHLSIENLARTGLVQPDITTGRLNIERGVLETFSAIGEPTGRFCVWTLPDSASGAVIKNIGSGRTLLEISDKFFGGLTTRYTQPMILLKQAF